MFDKQIVPLAKHLFAQPSVLKKYREGPDSKTILSEVVDKYSTEVLDPNNEDVVETLRRMTIEVFGCTSSGLRDVRIHFFFYMSFSW